MADLTFDATLHWTGTGRSGEGQVTLNKDHSIIYSSPVSMGGKGSGVSPEDFLIAAVSTCYSGTLFALLIKIGLPVQHVSIKATGTVTGYPLNAKFAKLLVQPTIIGGNPVKQREYESAAKKARDKCFIGKTMAGNVNYEVGTVKVTPSILEQNQVNVLVEEFYKRLLKEAAFADMFKERHVDIAQLKDRQRIFLSRIVNDQSPESESEESRQVRNRHRFHTSPERRKLWLDTMLGTIDDMDFHEVAKNVLKEKISRLMNHLG
ncbi:MAG: OsmC family protein [Tuberibacillus sp.]